MKTLQSKGNPQTGALGRAIQELGPWFHNLHLPDGTQTAPDHPLGDFPRFKWKQLAPHLPEEMKDWKVLDIGCNAGFYTLELAKRGANVMGIDIDPHYLRQARWAAEHYNLEHRVRFEEMPIYELAQVKENFDLVLFMGVFYHLRYPLLALDLVADHTKETLVFQSLSMPGGEGNVRSEPLNLDRRDVFLKPDWPKMAFIPGEFEGDATNWWAPNPAAAVALLDDVGFRVTGRPGHEIYIAKRRDDAPVGSPPYRTEMLAATGQAARFRG